MSIVFQMRRPRHREVEYHIQGHIARKRKTTPKQHRYPNPSPTRQQFRAADDEPKKVGC